LKAVRQLYRWSQELQMKDWILEYHPRHIGACRGFRPTKSRICHTGHNFSFREPDWMEFYGPQQHISAECGES
jgi:hypothetical protein